MRSQPPAPHRVANTSEISNWSRLKLNNLPAVIIDNISLSVPHNRTATAPLSSHFPLHPELCLSILPRQQGAEHQQHCHRRRDNSIRSVRQQTVVLSMTFSAHTLKSLNHHHPYHMRCSLKGNTDYWLVVPPPPCATHPPTIYRTERTNLSIIFPITL